MAKSCRPCGGTGRKRNGYRWATCPECDGSGDCDLIEVPRSKRPWWMKPEHDTVVYAHPLARHWRPILFLSVFGPLVAALWYAANHLPVNLVGRP